jgi:hypothetical protein
MGPTRHECPWDKITVQEVYVCNTGYRQVAEVGGRISKIFLAHTQVRIGERRYFNWDEFNYLISKGIKVYNTHKVKGLASLMYPMKRISKKFKCRDYFSDTIAYMIAFALDYATDVKDGKLVLNGKCNTLRFYGVDMHEFGEYGLEKGGVEYWIGYAQGLGMEVDISEGSTLLRTYTGKPYGEKTISLTKLLKGTGLDGKKIIKRPGYIYYESETPTREAIDMEVDTRREVIAQRKEEKKLDALSKGS